MTFLHDDVLTHIEPAYPTLYLKNPDGEFSLKFINDAITRFLTTYVRRYYETLEFSYAVQPRIGAWCFDIVKRYGINKIKFEPRQITDTSFEVLANHEGTPIAKLVLENTERTV